MNTKPKSGMTKGHDPRFTKDKYNVINDVMPVSVNDI